MSEIDILAYYTVVGKRVRLINFDIRLILRMWKLEILYYLERRLSDHSKLHRSTQLVYLYFDTRHE